MGKLPQKKYYRQRAHSNPMADHSFDYPKCPSLMNWKELYPKASKSCEEEPVTFADIGCGYGGLLMSLSPMFPEKKMVGMEIRVKVSDFVNDKITSLREDNPGQFQNIACVRTNAMKYLPNYFNKGQLEKVFFLFPDPHFKRSKHKWRIINNTLLAEYAYVLKEGGLVYTISDVKDLHEWMKFHFTDHPLFEPVEQLALDSDPVVKLLYDSTEEGQKVTRNSGDKYLAVFRRLPSPNK